MSLRFWLITLVLVVISGCDQPNMNPKGKQFFDMPWPSDLRLKDDGSLDLTGFPASTLNPVGYWISAQGGNNTFGFGTNSAVYFSFQQGIDSTVLPSALESILSDATVMLVNIEEGSAHYGQRDVFSSLVSF